MCLCVRPIFWYFISRLIEEKFIQDTKNIYKGRYIAFLRYSHIRVALDLNQDLKMIFIENIDFFNKKHVFYKNIKHIVN